MDIFVDQVAINKCRPLSELPKSNKKKKKNICEVTLSLRNIKSSNYFTLVYQRESATQDHFIPSKYYPEDMMDFAWVKKMGWVLPRQKIIQAIRVQYELNRGDLGTMTRKNELLKDAHEELVSFLVFGEVNQSNPKNFNARLTSRFIKLLFQAIQDKPTYWGKLNPALVALLNDPKLSGMEKERVEWAIDLGTLISEVVTFFPSLEKLPAVKKALVGFFQYLMSPDFNPKEYFKEPMLIQAVQEYYDFHSKRPGAISDLFQIIKPILLEFIKLPEFKGNRVLQGRYNRVKKLVDRAIHEKWTTLIVMKNGEDALKMGLISHYGKTENQSKVMEVFAKHVSVKIEGKSAEPQFHIAVDAFSQEVKRLIDSPEVPPKDRQEMLKFLSEVILGQLMAKGQNMEVFWDGAFRDKVNFYPTLSMSLERVPWAGLIDWTQKKLNSEGIEEKDPHVLLNKTSFWIGVGTAGLGALGTGLLWEDRNWRIASLSTLGGGAGAGLADLICYGANYSNKYGECAIVGGVLGGLLVGFLGAYLSPNSDPSKPIITMPPDRNPPDLRGPGHRWPTDPFGP